MEGERDAPRMLMGYDPIATAAEGMWYDAEQAQRVVDFFHKFGSHSKGAMAGQPFILERWQQDILRTMMGWMRSDGSRRYRTSLLFEPRKQGKSLFAAGLALYLLTADNEPGAEIYMAPVVCTFAQSPSRHESDQVQSDSFRCFRTPWRWPSRTPSRSGPGIPLGDTAVCRGHPSG